MVKSTKNTIAKTNATKLYFMLLFVTYRHEYVVLTVNRFYCERKYFDIYTPWQYMCFCVVSACSYYTSHGHYGHARSRRRALARRVEVPFVVHIIIRTLPELRCWWRFKRVLCCEQFSCHTGKTSSVRLCTK